MLLKEAATIQEGEGGAALYLGSEKRKGRKRVNCSIEAATVASKD